MIRFAFALLCLVCFGALAEASGTAVQIRRVSVGIGTGYNRQNFRQNFSYGYGTQQFNIQRVYVQPVYTEPVQEVIQEVQEYQPSIQRVILRQSYGVQRIVTNHNVYGHTQQFRTLRIRGY